MLSLGDKYPDHHPQVPRKSLVLPTVCQEGHWAGGGDFLTAIKLSSYSEGNLRCSRLGKSLQIRRTQQAIAREEEKLRITSDTGSGCRAEWLE